MIEEAEEEDELAKSSGPPQPVSTFGKNIANKAAEAQAAEQAATAAIDEAKENAQAFAQP